VRGFERLEFAFVATGRIDPDEGALYFITDALN
jgi:hypothetical protein